jgi:translation initiation factor 1
MRKAGGGGLVYSTDVGRTCPLCRQAFHPGACKAQASAPVAGDGTARVQRESKGRGGKVVTLVRGLPLAQEALAALGKQMRTACGTGGTLKEGVLELQGDHADRVVAWLIAEGYKAKRAGG